MQSINEVFGVVIGDILQGIGDALDEIVLADAGHVWLGLNDCFNQ
jgi:hypothetical protein